MRILIAGGTSFIGRAIAASAWRQGHDVTVVNRGLTPTDLPEGVERLVGDRRGDLSALSGRGFDACIDTIAYRPGDVEALATALNGQGGHHLQISSVSAYREPMSSGSTEADLELWDGVGLDLAAPITNETYGPLKAASERRAADLFGADTTFVRPTYVIGGHDATLRFPYWVQRARRGGTVAVPGPREAALQYVDARDLAEFVVRLVSNGVVGAFHTTGPNPPATYVETVERVTRQLSPRARVVVVEPERVREAGLALKFPLWPEDDWNSSTLDNSLALAHGLQLRPIEQSVNDVVRWWGEREWPEWWLSDDEQRTLLG